ncbi:hypothetical protein GOB94_09075 [Granulicella sp. 5B5]|uniref:hypothetical protein n=1 Tax=Granulicella sp. 5B5 TaxID=1617967 RepID=UPI0015F55241|nr:hypothetical protein [Granulicella sp. 5B5]QMV18816.1 hypothetical protein GOB94_09075 [Granulicella sp. 5B5]
MVAFYYRQQIYVRDFRASVTRNGVVEDGAQVFFNLNDDVLLENDNAPMYITLLQHDMPVREPARLNCVHFFVCFVANDGATLVGSDDGARLLQMSKDQVTYRDSEGKTAVVSFH